MSNGSSAASLRGFPKLAESQPGTGLCLYLNALNLFLLRAIKEIDALSEISCLISKSSSFIPTNAPRV